ncbi:MAG: hypothetical protein KatS3mg110_4242 [Pirellulaceae bacterium]|nr:MAG: hypothetical protein KatS3mg110_4242 [Pirellulaceae bacterium]
MAGRQREFEQVINEHFARIHRAALLLTGNPWDADDLAQETFLVFARSRHRFGQRSRLYTWLYGILLNLEKRERRRRFRERRRIVEWHGRRQAWPETEPGAGWQLEWTEWKQSLWAQVATLPDGQRHALVLRFGEGLRYEEIAAVLGCPLGTVKSRIYNGLMALRAWCRQNESASDSIDFSVEGQ